ncbi:MAG: nucleotidyl transferase AbiEii/AbiGii toxin family protein, partial [Bacteroidales bacterium]|nr:nucleotidyl transferase AbiEii/AbiGii toxin family protein [Bacteroidales bacterium]
EMTKEIAGQLIKLGIDKSHFSVEVNITSVTTVDPETVRIVYKSVLPELKYIQSSILIETGARSMIEPTERVMVQSIIAEKLPSAGFVDKGFILRVVTPKRTFLEKAFLLHEEFAKPSNEIRINRMSRHLYDLERLMDTSFAKDAMEDTKLYNAIVEHRRKFIGLKGFDYNTLYPHTISFLPPDSIIDSWRTDYETMCTTMIYGKYLSFDELINRVKELNQRFRMIKVSQKM